MHILDPIHGTIDIDPPLRQVIDSRAYQRLRFIKQLGFCDIAFPGATHVRFAHGIGSMHVAGALFDALYQHPTLSALAPADTLRLRTTLRLAVLLHDLGHPPFSHATEGILPLRATLGLPAWTLPTAEESDLRATHEDMTLLLILRGDLHQVLREHFGPLGIDPSHVAALIAGLDLPEGSPFCIDGVDHFPLLRSLVSGELDADRMDYLLRDSLYTGVQYGRYDLGWIIRNVVPVRRGRQLHLGIGHRGVVAFEDFLLSRYHMFTSVYLHHRSVEFEYMLSRFFAACPDAFPVSADPESYLEVDDMALMQTLRKHPHPWARRLLTQRGDALLVEVSPYEAGRVDLSPVCTALTEAGIDHHRIRSRGVLSKYQSDPGGGSGLWVHTARGEDVPVEHYTPVFAQSAGAAVLERLFVDPERLDEARRLAGPLARAVG